MEDQEQGQVQPTTELATTAPLTMRSLDARLSVVEAKLADTPEPSEDEPGTPSLEDRFNTLVERLQSRVHGIGAV